MEETFDPDLLAEFVSESLQGLRDTEQDLLSLEGDGEVDVELVNRIFRAVHSIKGCAGFMGLTNLVRVAHRGETLLDCLRSGKTRPTPEITDAVLAGNDALVTMLNEPDVGTSYDCEAVLEKLDRVLASLESDRPEPTLPEGSTNAGTAADSPTAAAPAPSSSDAPATSVPSAPDVLAPQPDEQDLELLAEFVCEALQGLQDVEQDLLTLENAEQVDMDLINRVFRAVHTIKGTGSFLGLTNLVGVSHRAETLLDEVRKGTMQPSAHMADAVLAAVDALKAMLLERDLGASYDSTDVLWKLDAVLGNPAPGEPPGQPATSTPAAAPAPAPTAAPSAPTPSAPAPTATAPSAPAPPAAERASAAAPAPAARESTAGNKSTATAATADQTMRVPVRILEELLKWTGNMVMARNQLMHEFDFAGSTAFHTLSQAITGVHETVIETRMQTTGSLFERYRRVVRDLARQLGKEIAFHIEGGDLELDRTILESFADPLTHLVRNCCDHALEIPDEREAAGKNRQGNVFLRSYVQSGEIILEVQDDGRGIPAEVICRKAIEKGLISQEDAASLNEQQKIMLIFEPGFSTKEQATDVSGRGVGMDVVRNNIEKVGGSIEVRTKLGEGSVFAAHLPLAKALVSSSLTSALIVEVDGQIFAVPETAVSEIIRCDKSTNRSIHQVDGRDVYQLRDQLIALIDLRVPLEMDCGRSSTNRQLADVQPGDSRCLVILQYRNHLFGTIVDNVIGIQEIIVQSTPKLLQNCIVYSGHTVMGNGNVALILDVNGIVTKLKLEFTQRSKRSLSSRPAQASRSRSEVADAAATQKMLLFNYSASEYFAIPLELVALIERVSTNDLQTVGNNEFCQFKSETVSVMRLSDFLPITPLDREQKEFCLIRPAAVEYPLGILTGLDLSVLDVTDTFETRLDDGKGVVGTFMHQDRLIMMLDLFGIFERHAPDKLRVDDDSTQPATILIAEDSLFFRKLIAQYVQKPEWTVDVVNDGQEAWEMLQENPTRYNLVISDINMPRMDGFELAMQVREDRRFDKLPLIALTTMADDHFRQKGLALGFDEYVIKIDKREVRSTVSQCLRIKR